MTVENVTIEDIAAEGVAVLHIEGKVCFVPFGAPGDVVDLFIYKKKRQYLEGRIIKIHKKSEERREPICKHFGTCGGCKWQHINYQQQLLAKQKTVTDNLQRIGKLDVLQFNEICPSQKEFYYRNKLEFTFSNRKWLTDAERNNDHHIEKNALGFHIPGMFDKVLNIEECFLQNDLSNNIRNFLRDYALNKGYSFYDVREHNGFFRNVIIRTTSIGETMVIVVFGMDENIYEVLDNLYSKFPEITSLQYVLNTKRNDTINDLELVCYKGRDYIVEHMQRGKNSGDVLKFKIGPKSFYQTNSLQASNLYRIATEFANFKGDEIVYDLYTGAGTIAIYIANLVDKVIGIEYVEDAIKDARINAINNSIVNLTFYAGDMVDVLNDDLFAKHGLPDVIITDPPRAGMHPKVVQQILNAAPKKIVYVSCNSATQARDLAMMADNYIITKSQAVDMFPQTHHIENVVLLEKK